MTITLNQRPARPLTALDGSRPATRRTTSPTTRPTTRATTNPTTRGGWERNSDRRDRLHLGLSELFSARGDLEGVSAVADVLAEDLLWST